MHATATLHSDGEVGAVTVESISLVEDGPDPRGESPPARQSFLEKVDALP